MRRWSVIAWVVSAVLLLALIAALANVVRSDEASEVPTALASGERPVAPALPTAVVPGTSTPKAPVLGDAMDGPVVVNWWASWCGPCRDEMPLLVKLARDWRDDGVVVVGVNAEDIASDARAFLDDYSVDYPVVRASADDKLRWGVRGFPETYVVGRDGRISARIDGPVDERSLRALVERELER